MNRREFLPLAGAGVLSGYAGWRGGRKEKKEQLAPPPETAAVAVVKAASYRDDLAGRILEGVRACKLDVRGKCVLLKPNMVEFDADTCINTDVAVVMAAYEVFHQLGASKVLIGEGPGHRRDTYALAEGARYRESIPNFEDTFVNLNIDDVTPVQGFADRGQIYLPNTALRADLVVSLAKMKTHHWAGATLSMKNFFGLVPGCVYGWPKNELHQIGITQSILELNRVFSRSFAIVDGIVGMEGNGPIQGTPKPAGVLVMGENRPAVDATCCRIMGIDPHQIEYLSLAAGHLGVIAADRIEQRGEDPASVRTDFRLIDKFKQARLAS